MSDAQLLSPTAGAARQGASLPELRQILGDYRFVGCHERTPLAEVWRLRTRTGKNFLAHLLRENLSEHLREQLANWYIPPHPNLLPSVVIPQGAGQILLLTEVPAESLADRFQKYWKRGWSGMPAEELLHLLRQAAETLDELYHERKWQHFGLNPWQLWIEGDQLKISGFGMAETLWIPTENSIHLLNPKYCAPELYSHRQTSQCDQFSLALVYVEMRTGNFPIKKRSGNDGAWTTRDLDLALLAAAEREILQKALSRDPFSRFENCTDLIHALARAPQGERASTPGRPTFWEPLMVHQSSASWKYGATVSLNSLDQFVTHLLGKSERRSGVHLDGLAMRQNFPIEIASPDTLDDFCREWYGQIVNADERHIEMFVPHPSNLLSKWLGRVEGFQVKIEWVPHWMPEQAPGEALVSIRPTGCAIARGRRLLQRLGPAFFDSLRQHLKARPDKRDNPRHSFHHRVRVCPIAQGNQYLDEPIDGVAKDLSTNGIGFFLPYDITSTHVYVSIPEVGEIAQYAGLAKIVRNRPHEENGFEFGAAFAFPKRRPKPAGEAPGL